MTGYLSRLAERSLGVADTVRPRVASRYEPASGIEPLEIVEERMVEPELPATRSAEYRTPALPPPEGSVSRQTEPESAAVESSQEQPHGPDTPALPPGRSHRAGPVAATAEPPTIEIVAVHTDAAPSLEAAVEADPPHEPERRPTRVPSGPRPTTPRRARIDPRAPESADPERLAEPRSVRLIPPSTPEPAIPLVSAEEPPVVHVTIGRVDVRAVLPSAPAEHPRPKRAPRMTLDEYLEKSRAT